MRKLDQISLVNRAAASLLSIRPGRSDSVRGAIAFQNTIVAWRGYFSLLAWSLQEDDFAEATRLVDAMEKLGAFDRGGGEAVLQEVPPAEVKRLRAALQQLADRDNWGATLADGPSWISNGLPWLIAQRALSAEETTAA